MSVRIPKSLLAVAAVALTGIVAAVALPRFLVDKPVSTPAARQPVAELVSSTMNTIAVPADVVRTLAIATDPATAAPSPSPLRLDGKLLPDTNRLAHVHTRFSGEVVEIGTTQALSDDPTIGPPKMCVRPLRFGDKVAKGQLLAALWSTDLGEKKSELVVALSRLTLHKETAARFEALISRGAATERNLREAEQIVEADQVAVENAKQTLRTWRLNEGDIDLLVEEATRIHKRVDKANEDLKANWARVEVRAPQDGVIVERNVALGDFIDSQLDMFKIADLNRLEVAAHVYEEDLKLIEDRPTEDWSWKVYLRNDLEGEPLVGRFTQIGVAFDPHQQTTLVRGWVDNTKGRLRIGQFVVAEIDLDPMPGALAVPASAVVDRDGRYQIFVQLDPDQPRYQRRRVNVLRRCEGMVFLGSPEHGRSAEGIDEIKAGDLVVTKGGFELAAELEQLQAMARARMAADK